jgi:hypothetical protein
VLLQKALNLVLGYMKRLNMPVHNYNINISSNFNIQKFKMKYQTLKMKIIIGL